MTVNGGVRVPQVDFLISGFTQGSSPRASRGDRRRFQFCIERLQSLRRLFLQLCHSFGSSAGAAHGELPARLPHLVGSRPPSPYHFRARIQSFQAVAAPFPGDSVLPSDTLAPRPRRPPLGSYATFRLQVRVRPKYFTNGNRYFSSCLSNSA